MYVQPTCSFRHHSYLFSYTHSIMFSLTHTHSHCFRSVCFSSLWAMWCLVLRFSRVLPITFLVGVYVCMYVIMYVCMYVCMYVMYVCMHVCISTHKIVCMVQWMSIECMNECVMSSNLSKTYT